MTDDLSAHDIEDLRALMRKHHLLPEVPAALLDPAAPVVGGTSSGTETSELVGAAGVQTAASEAMLARILATPRPAAAGGALGAPGEAATPAADLAARRATRLRRRGAALAVAAATVVATVVGTQMGSTPDAVAAGAPELTYSLGSPADAWDASLPSAHDALLQLAEAAEDAPDLPRSGDVQYVAQYSWLSESEPGALTTTVYPTADQRWTAADGSTQIVERRAEPVTYTGEIDTTAGPSAAGTVSTTDMLAGSSDPFAVATLPTDPGSLTTALLADSADYVAENPQSQDSVLASSMVAQFGFSIVPQDVVAALWTLLADAPTVQLVGETTDRFGRSAVAVAVPDTTSTTDGFETVEVLVISPADGQLLGTETVTLSDPTLELDASVDEATVTGFTAIADRRWASAVGD